MITAGSRKVAGRIISKEGDVIQDDCLFYYLPVIDPSGRGRETYSDFEHLSRVVYEWLAVALVFDLSNGCVGGDVDFQFDDIDVVFGSVAKVCVQTYI